MATKSSIAIRQSKSRDTSPKWDGAKEMTGEQFTKHFRQSMEYYRLESSVKELKPKLVEVSPRPWDRSDSESPSSQLVAWELQIQVFALKSLSVRVVYLFDSKSAELKLIVVCKMDHLSDQ